MNKNIPTVVPFVVHVIVYIVLSLLCACNSTPVTSSNSGSSNTRSINVTAETPGRPSLLKHSSIPIIFKLTSEKVQGSRLLECRNLNIHFFLPKGQGVVEFSPTSSFKTTWDHLSVVLAEDHVNANSSKKFTLDKNIPNGRKIFVRIKDYASGKTSEVYILR